MGKFSALFLIFQKAFFKMENPVRSLFISQRQGMQKPFHLSVCQMRIQNIFSIQQDAFFLSGMQRNDSENPAVGRECFPFYSGEVAVIF